MGDGPGYDHMYDTLEQKGFERNELRKKRLEILRQMYCSVGFGGSDGSYGEDLLATEAVRHLKMAHAILEQIVR